MDTFSLLISTIGFRPYVFIFLLAFLIAGTFKVGPKKTLVFLVSGWAIAFFCEFTSVRHGIPFGFYEYIPSTTDKELWLWGIPFIDSLSFPFLAYASWTLARFMLAKNPYRSGPLLSIDDPMQTHDETPMFSWDIILLGAVLFMLLDVVIDPVALRGDQWFLGQIYRYPEPGPYFGVTVENFVGWFIVGVLILTAWRIVDENVRVIFMIETFPTLDLWGPMLYYGVLGFNLYMAFSIGELNIGWAGVFIHLPILLFFMLKVVRGRI
jgi:putative membrane protein